VIALLVDNNFAGYAALLRDALAAAGWSELVPMRWVTLTEVGLHRTSSDRAIWRSAQAHGLILITDNRNMKGRDSLEQTLREENTPEALPVLTIGSAERLKERSYRDLCATRIVEIVLNLESHRGVGRIFIP